MDTNKNNVSGRASYTEDERRELVEIFSSSGLTQAAFCRKWNINPKTLGRWLRIERQETELSFCEVNVPAAPPRVDELRICLPNGIEVHLRISLPDQLGSVLREVARCLD